MNCRGAYVRSSKTEGILAMFSLHRWVALGLVGVLAGFGATTPVAAQAPSTFTLQPGGTAVVQFEAFCTEFGEVFPTRVQLPNGVAPERARAALSYGVGKGLSADPATALQLQYAIWQALGTTTSPKGDATAQDVVTNGTAVPANPQATSVIDAATANQITVTLDTWQPIGPKVAITATATDHFYGRGQLTIANTSSQAVTLYMPVGTIFPSVDPAQQTMAGYATAVQVTNPAPVQQQLPTTSGVDFPSMLPLVALGLLMIGGTLRVIHVRGRRA